MQINLELLSIGGKYSSQVRADVQIMCILDTAIVEKLNFKIVIFKERKAPCHEAGLDLLMRT